MISLLIDWTWNLFYLQLVHFFFDMFIKPCNKLSRFHAKEYLAYDEKVFPVNMGYCQKGRYITASLAWVLWGFLYIPNPFLLLIYMFVCICEYMCGVFVVIFFTNFHQGLMWHMMIQSIYGTYCGWLLYQVNPRKNGWHQVSLNQEKKGILFWICWSSDLHSIIMLPEDFLSYILNIYEFMSWNFCNSFMLLPAKLSRLLHLESCTCPFTRLTGLFVFNLYLDIIFACPKIDRSPCSLGCTSGWYHI